MAALTRLNSLWGIAGARASSRRRHILRNTRLRHNDALVTDGQMPRNADLARDGYLVANDGATGDADQRADKAMIADGAVVADLNEVVDFRTLAHAGPTKATAVDGRVGTDLDVVANLDVTDLGIFRCLPPTVSKPNPSAPSTTPQCSITRSPMIVRSRRLTRAYSRQSALDGSRGRCSCPPQ